MTPHEIARLKALCERASKGWTATPNDDIPEDEDDWALLDEQGDFLAEELSADDARFMAAARKHFPAALDEIERLRKALAPFAAEAAGWGTSTLDNEVTVKVRLPDFATEFQASFSMADIRRAKEALDR